MERPQLSLSRSASMNGSLLVLAAHEVPFRLRPISDGRAAVAKSHFGSVKCGVVLRMDLIGRYIVPNRVVAGLIQRA